MLATLLTAVARGQGVTVSGTVRDSVAGSPLAGALVQLVAADSANAMPRTVVADSVGRFRIDGVTRGSYVISFLHPILDTLTLEPILHSLQVSGNLPVVYDLGTPSGSRLRTVFCGPRTVTNSGAAFVGVARDAETLEPLSGVSVVAEWLDLVIGRGGMAHQTARRATTTAANGWFALCNLPGPGQVRISARRAADTTDLIDVSMPTSQFVRRDLFVGSTTDGSLMGRVVNEKGSPLSGAIVHVGNGTETRTGPDGEWKFNGIAAGTRMLEVRAIGYYPERRSVDVIRTTGVVRIQLATFESVLDTMRVSASVLRGADEGGFEQRRRSSGSGRFLTEKDIGRRSPIVTSELFKSVPGMSVTADDIVMRSAFSMDGCPPAVFLDGRLMPPLAKLSPLDVDSWVSPSQISSIEIYPDVPPPQFQVALSGCGSIVIWTKRRVPVRKPPR